MIEENQRIYGNSPFRVAVIHGGPGAPGQMAPVAKELSEICGVIEPLQTAMTVNDQIEELKGILEKHCELPVILIGSSWGAVLSFIFASKYPAFVEKLILVGSAPFEEKYADNIMETRLIRLNDDEKIEVNEIILKLSDSSIDNKDSLMAKLGGELFFKTDTFDPINGENDLLKCDYEQHIRVWGEAHELRKSGELLRFVKDIKCKVIAIHGDYDPHPSEGVRKPLAMTIKDFTFHELKKCGHYPWKEKSACQAFYKLLKSYI